LVYGLSLFTVVCAGKNWQKPHIAVSARINYIMLRLGPSIKWQKKHIFAILRARKTRFIAQVPDEKIYKRLTEFNILALIQNEYLLTFF